MKLGAGGVAVAVTGGIGLALRGTVEREPRRPRKVLTRKQFSVLAAFAERITPPFEVHGRTAPSPWEVEVPEQVDALLAGMHPADTAEIADALGVIESAAAGLLLEGRTSTFTASSPAAQDRIIESWRTSDLALRRKAYRALAGLCRASYYASPAVFAFVGYTGHGALAHEEAG